MVGDGDGVGERGEVVVQEEGDGVGVGSSGGDEEVGLGYEDMRG